MSLVDAFRGRNQPQLIPDSHLTALSDQGGTEAAFDAAVLMKALPIFHGSRSRLEKPLCLGESDEVYLFFGNTAKLAIVTLSGFFS